MVSIGQMDVTSDARIMLRICIDGAKHFVHLLDSISCIRGYSDVLPQDRMKNDIGIEIKSFS